VKVSATFIGLSGF